MRTITILLAGILAALLLGIAFVVAFIIDILERIERIENRKDD